jgi:hypothetical protein
MSLENANVVDAAGIEHHTGLAVLTIADSWTWDDVEGHLSAMQNKINAYFAFIESGEIFAEYPAARGRPIAIDIVSRFEVPDSAANFLAAAANAAADLNVVVRHRHFPAERKRGETETGSE